MGFSIYTEKREDIIFYILKNDITEEYMEIVPEIGGTVNKICLNVDDCVKNILFSDIDSELKKNKLHKARLLFPFNDRIPDGKYSFDGETYQLDINSTHDGDNSSIHGFLCDRKMDFLNKEINSDSASLTLKVDMEETDHNGYPFHVRLEVTYILKENEVSLQFKIENPGSKKAPIALGWHPYFTFENSLKDVNLQCAADKYCEFDESFLPTGNVLDCKDTEFDFHSPRSIDGMDVDNAFVVPEDGKVKLTRNNSTIEYTQDTDVFKYIQFFIPPQHNSIAVEPITAVANCFNMPELGLVVINPGDTIKTWAQVKVY